ncbi:MAG: DMT family transporter [Sphingopyxis sp.]
MADARISVAKENLSADKHNPPAEPRGAFAALLLGNAALASGPLFVRMADVGPVAAGFWRLALALPVLALCAWAQWRATMRAAAPLAGGAHRGIGQWRGIGAMAVLGGIFFAADLASWHMGIVKTTMANATLFGNSASLFLAIATWVIARRAPRWSEGAAIALATAGAGILLRESGQQGAARMVGDALCLLAGLLYTGYVLAMQRARNAMASWSALALSTGAGALPLALFAMAMGETVVPQIWSAVLLLALFSQIIGQGLLIYALPHFSALVIGLTLLTQPALAAAIGWMAYGEGLGTMDYVGGAMVAAALVLVRLPTPAAPA